MFLFLNLAQAACLLVSGVTPAGEPLSIRIEGGTIQAVGAVVKTGCKETELPANAVLTPGLVEVNSVIGVAEVGLESDTVDTDGEGDPVRAAMRVADAYNPRSTRVPVKRLGGITSAVVVPHGGLVAGQAGWVRLAGETQAEAVVRHEVATLVSTGGPSRAMALEKIRELVEDARAFAADPDSYDERDMRQLAEGTSRRDLEAFLPAAQGERPMIVGADRAADIEALLRLQAELGLSLVIQGGAEAWVHAEALSKAQVPVILDPLVMGPGSFRMIQGRPDNAKLLDEAGVLVMFDTWTHNAPLSAQLAGNAVRAGMSKQAALDAITINPALAFDMPLRTGLKPGNAADLVAWSGDPLELSSHPLLIVINGEIQPLDSRQRALFRRYRELPGSPVPALSLP